jgi:hypothetical protein
MKKIILMALAISSLLSCSNSDDDNSSVAIDGTWKLTAFSTQDPCDFNNDGVATTNFMNETGCYNNSKIVFTGSNTATAAIQEVLIDMTVTVGTTNGYTVVVDCEANPIPENVPWSQNGNIVTIGASPDNLDFTLSGNTLSATIPNFTQIQTYQNGTIITDFTGATLVFTKQ